MPDVSIRASATAAAPLDYVIPGAQEIFPKAVSAHMDGSGASGEWLPCLQVLDPAGHVMFSAVGANGLSAGAIADVSWYPAVGTSGGSAPIGSTVNVTDGVTTVNGAGLLEVPPASVSNDSGNAKITLGNIYWVPPPTGVAATDNANIQAGLTNVTTGGIVALCPGTYAITGLTVSKTCRLMGAGGADDLWAHFGTLLTLNSQAGVAITVNAHGCTFENFALQCTYSGTPSSTSAGIQTLSGAGNGQHYGPKLSVRGFYINVDHQAGAEWFMDPSCFMYDFVSAGLKIQNVDSVDGGDMVVSGQFVAGPVNNGTVGLTWWTGGGLKLYSAKFNNRGGKTLTAGISIEMQDGVTTGDLLFSNCSIENSTYGILAENAGGLHTATLKKIVICGNQFDLANIASSYCIRLQPAAAGQLSVINISGNTFSEAANGIGFGNLDNLSHGPNVFESSVTTPINNAGGTTNITSVGNG